MRAVPSLSFTFVAVNDEEEEAEDDVLLSASVSFRLILLLFTVSVSLGLTCCSFSDLLSWRLRSLVFNLAFLTHAVATVISPKCCRGCSHKPQNAASPGVFRREPCQVLTGPSGRTSVAAAAFFRLLFT